MPLSEFSVRNAKPRDKPCKLVDSGGLYLAIQPRGSKLWRLKYRFAGKEKILSFGQYLLVSIADARRQRDDAKRQLPAGNDPSMQRKMGRMTATTAARTTFGLIAEEYIHRMKANEAADGTIVKIEWLLLDLAKPLAKRPLKEIAPAEILNLLQRIEKSGRRETARRRQGAIGGVFRLTVVTLRAVWVPNLGAIHHARRQIAKIGGKVARRNSRPAIRAGAGLFCGGQSGAHLNILSGRSTTRPCNARPGRALKQERADA